MVFQVPEQNTVFRPPAVVPPKFWVYVNPALRLVTVSVLDPVHYQDDPRVPVISFLELSAANALRNDVRTQGMLYQLRAFECGGADVFAAYRPNDEVKSLVLGHMDGDFCSLCAPWPPNSQLIEIYHDYASAKAALEVFVRR